MREVIFKPPGQHTFESNPNETVNDIDLSLLLNSQDGDAGILAKFSDGTIPVSRTTKGYIFPEETIKALVKNTENAKIEGVAIRYGLAGNGALHLVFIPVEKKGDKYLARYDLAKTTYTTNAFDKDPILTIPPHKA